MAEVFRNVLTASFHGSVVILAVLLLRLALKKTPKKFLCLLWLLAGIRLLMPFEIQSGLSLQPDIQTIRDSRITEVISGNLSRQMELPEFTPQVAPLPESKEENTFLPIIPEEEIFFEEPGDVYYVVPQTQPLSTEASFATIAAWVWLGVACCFALYTLVSYLRLRMLVRQAIRVQPGIWECETIETAFILGFIRPQIYLPMGMSPPVRGHILAHERTHLEKGDHWIKMIGFIALSLHWFNPLVWLAYILLCKDIEMACDERVVQFMELEERKSYSAALLNCSTNKAHFAACPVAFGEVSVKKRILSVLNYKKPGFWISLAGIIAIAFVAVCLLTSPTREESTAEPPVESMAAEETVQTLPPQQQVIVKTVDELLAALASDTRIILEAGNYNLSEAATYGKETGSDHYNWSKVYDGYELVISGLNNVSIQGSGVHVTVVETDPRYADVLVFRNCEDVALSDLTAGHTRDRGECGGGVLTLTACDSVAVERLGLYGCGVVGLTALDSTEITLTDSDIYECSSSAATLENSADVTISGCRLYKIGSEQYGGYTFFDIRNTQTVTIENCEISDSTLGCMLCAYGSTVEMRNNLICGNRFMEGAMSLQDVLWVQTDAVIPVDVRLVNNKFEDNSIRNWYTISNGVAQDETGRALTQEILEERYGTEPVKPKEPQLQIHVSTVDEFIAAIGPDKEIVLDAELYDFSTATGYGTSKGEYYFWEDVFDGPGLVIQNVDNMTIRSNDGNAKGHTLAAIPRYADVLAFKACSNVTVSGFTAGHTKEQGSCAGGVLEFRDSDHITVDNCGLFGCGILGVQTEACSDVTVKNCEIYECSEGGIKMWDTSGVVIQNTTFRDIAGSNIMMFSGCRDVTANGEILIPENQTGTVMVETPEQKNMNALSALVHNFIYYYRTNDVEQLQMYLASTYTGDVTVWADGEDYGDVGWTEVTLDHVGKIEAEGSCTFEVVVRRWSPEKSDWEEGQWTLTFTVIREKGEYKVSEYSLK